MITLKPFLHCSSGIVRLVSLFWILWFFTEHAVAQPENDRCSDATDVTTAVSDSLFTCITGTFAGAMPDPITAEGCELSAFRTVWYKFSMGLPRLINLHIRSEQLETPVIRLFRSTEGGCIELKALPIEEHYDYTSYCVEGVDGKAEVIAKLLPEGEYFIAISTLDAGSGSFTLCLNGLLGTTPCVVMSPISVTYRSCDGPLTGPFFPGEKLGFNVEVVNEAGRSSSCDYFQGLVPVLGKTWDDRHAESHHPPEFASINGQYFGEPGNAIYGGTWDWHADDVDYHVSNPQIRLDYFPDALTVPSLKHRMYEPQIDPMSPHLVGTCCPPCYSFDGSILPPGWFCEGLNSNCNMTGRVRYRWGDGPNDCRPLQGPWAFGFELSVRNSIPDCWLGGDLELYLSLFSFTDGLVGSWTPDYKCMNDPYAFKRLPVVCNDFFGGTIPSRSDIRTLCPGDSVIIAVDSLFEGASEATYWTYAFDSPDLPIASSGYVLPGHEFVFTEEQAGEAGGFVSGWLQAYRSARELLGRCYVARRYLQVPAAAFTWQVVDSMVWFSGAQGDNVTYQWDFGDGGTSGSRYPEHAYVAEGAYNVQLIVTNACGADTTEQLIFFIYQSPDAGFVVPDSVICRFDSLTFTHGFDGIVDSLRWHFEGGWPAFSTDSIVTVTYPEIGLFDVELTIYNPLGMDTKIREYAVEVRERVDLEYTAWVLDSLVYLIYLGDYADSVKWEIGDSFSWNGDTAQYVVDLPGIYPVTLWVSNACGQDSIQFSIEIIKTSVADGNNGDGVQIYPNPTNGSVYISLVKDFLAGQLSLHDMEGYVRHRQDILQGEPHPLKLDLGSLGLVAGVYVLTLTSHNRIERRTIVYIQ